MRKSSFYLLLAVLAFLIVCGRYVLGQRPAVGGGGGGIAGSLSTNGTNGQILASNGVGGFGTPYSVTTSGASSSIPEIDGSGKLTAPLFVGNPGVSTDQWEIDGRTTFGLGIPIFKPVTANTQGAIDITPNGTPNNYSADLGVSWIDTCNTDVGHTGTNFECLRLSMQKPGSGAYASLTTAASGTGSVRPLILQQNGGPLGIGPSTNTYTYPLDIQNTGLAGTYQAQIKSTATGSTAVMDVHLAQADSSCAGDYGIGGNTFNVTQLRNALFIGTESNCHTLILANGTVVVGDFGPSGFAAMGYSSNSTNVVSFSTTPNFDFSKGNTQEITLTGNVTSWTVSNIPSGGHLEFIICQDGTGSRTFSSPPASVHGFMTIGSTLSRCSSQTFTTDATNIYATSTGVINQ